MNFKYKCFIHLKTQIWTQYPVQVISSYFLNL